MINSISISYTPDVLMVEGSDLTAAELAWTVLMFERWHGTNGTNGVGEAVTLGITPFAITDLGQEGKFMLLLTVTQQCGLSLDPRDANGNPAPLDGVPVWSSSNDSVMTVTAAADGLTAVAKAAGALGTAQVNVTADARIGPETVELSGTLDVSVQAGEAVTLGISTGTPEEQGGPAPTPTR